MTEIRQFARFTVPVSVFCLLGAAVLWAQSQPGDVPGSLTALVGEVRQLRVAVEDSTRTQSQIQMLSVYLSAQQSRMIQVTSRLDATRRELADAAARSREAAIRVSNAQTEAVEAKRPEEREEAADMVHMFKEQVDAAAAREQALRAREAELLQAWQAEEARWAELITKLEQSVKR